MAFDYHSLGSEDYAEMRDDLMVDMWGFNRAPYVSQFGTARIGPNLDLIDNMDALVHIMLGSKYDAALVDLLRGAANQVYNPGQSGKLIRNLNEVMRDWARDHDLPKRFETFDPTRAQIRELLPAAMQPFEDQLPGEVGIPDSSERAVLISLLHENVDASDIFTAISDFERTTAWFELRYDTNGASETLPSAAIARRRYMQSDVFDLYNPGSGTVPFSDAEDTGHMYSDNRQRILEYENTYVPRGDTIVDHLQRAIRSFAEHYSIDVGRAEEILYVGRTPFSGDDLPGNLNNRRNDDDLIIGTNSTDIISGGAGNDVILGDQAFDTDSQVDVLDGGAGNDRLYGGGGADTLIGGAGNDVLWGGGGAGDQLIGGKGNDIYYLTDDASTAVGGKGGNTPDPSLMGGTNDDVITELRAGGRDTVVVWVSSGEFDLKNIEKFKLAADISGNVSVLLNQFDDFVLSTGDDQLKLTINKLQKTPIVIDTNGGADTITIAFEPGVDPSQVLNGRGLTARFKFTDLSANDTIDLSLLNIEDIVMNRDRITEDKGFYLMAPGSKLDLMDHGRIEKTYNNYTDSWFVVKCGDDTPYGPEFIGNIDRSNFDI